MSKIANNEKRGLRERVWQIIFQADTPAGKFFDIVLLWIIGLSVVVVMLESVDSVRLEHQDLLVALEWGFTIVFTIEYFLRLWIVKDRRRYALSFFGIVDLVSILPTWLELFLTGSHYLMIVRVLRLLRMFRVLKMAQHSNEAGVLLTALRASRHKVSVFFSSVLVLVCIEGTMIYMIEHAANPAFPNIPQSIYWAIVTMTTVGYGNITPVTVLGKMMASVIMLTGFAIIAVPTGIVTAELGKKMNSAPPDGRRCEKCGAHGHGSGANFCAFCGEKLAG